MYTISYNEDFAGAYNPSNPTGESYSVVVADIETAIERAEQLDADGAFKVEVRDSEHFVVYSIDNVRN
jgi:hypothetical protein